MARPRTFDEPNVTRQARDAFHDHGYAATSVEHLTAATGLSRSSLYGAFGDKHGLFLRSFAQYCDEQGQTLEAELVGDDAGAYDRLARHLRVKAADPDASQRGCLLAKSTAELAGDDPEVLAMASEFYDRYERLLTDCVAGAQAAGDLRSDIAAANAGALLLATLRGIEALGRAGRSPAALTMIGETALAALSAP
jgi:AcrR family transcriptional regulator